MLGITLLPEASNLTKDIFVAGYIDPGSGSILFQYVIAAVIGAAFYFRGLVYKFAKFIGRFFKRNVDE